jgi:hypothetical protein
MLRKLAAGRGETMRRTQKLVLLSRLANELSERGSWVGETHLQKAVYMLETLTGVPLGFPFVLYKHGPFSFDLREELNRMRADGMLELQPRPAPYGPSFVPTDAARRLEDRFPKTLATYIDQINFVAARVGSKSASELERLATALLLMDSERGTKPARLAEELNTIKPHVPIEMALAAVEEMEAAAAQAPRVPA